MPKRYIDSDTLNKTFVRKMPVKYKLFWIYLFCKCNHAGIWEIDTELASLLIGEKIDLNEAIEYINYEKIRIIPIANNNKLFIPGYIDIHYKGGLTPGNNAHDSCIEILKKYKLINEKNEIIIDFCGAGETLPRVRAGDIYTKSKSKLNIKRKKKKIENTIPPAIEWVVMYFQEKGVTGKDGEYQAERFMDHYSSNGWLVGKAKASMKDWKAAVRNWLKNMKEWGGDKKIQNKGPLSTTHVHNGEYHYPTPKELKK